MKISNLLIVACCLFVCSNNQLKADSMGKSNIEIGFTPKLTATDLQIKKLTAKLENDQIKFTLTYHSQTDRYLSFFNPPNGDKLKYFDKTGIKSKDTSVVFLIAKDKFKVIGEITMRVSTYKNAENDRNFIFLDMFDPAVLKLLESPTISLNGQLLPAKNEIKPVVANNNITPIEIKFVTSFTSPDFKINQLSATSVKNQIEFTLKYTSKTNKFLSFFNPPKGDVLMYLDKVGIRENDSITTFQIPKENFKSVDKITMRFSSNKNAEKDRNFISIDMSDLELSKLLGMQ